VCVVGMRVCGIFGAGDSAWFVGMSAAGARQWCRWWWKRQAGKGTGAENRQAGGRQQRVVVVRWCGRLAGRWCRPGTPESVGGMEGKVWGREWQGIGSGAVQSGSG